jgi:hypothetical protein
MPDTNFLQWNPSGSNQENDASYQSDAQRTGGATTGAPFPSLTANKLFYQLSTFVSALAFAMISKGYSPVDGSSPLTAAGSPSAAVSNLALVLENLIANSDLQDGSSPYVGAFLQNASLSGTSTSTTPSTTDSSTRVATTQYVQRQNYVAGSSTPQLVQGGSASGGAATFATPFSSTPAVTISEFGGSCNLISVSPTGFSYNFSGSGDINFVAIGNR